MITDNTAENDLLAETIEELGQSLTELQQVINDIKQQVNYREETEWQHTTRLNSELSTGTKRET